MAYVVKNTSKVLGKVKVDGKWRSVSPGESFRVSQKPSCRSFGIKVIDIPPEASKKQDNKNHSSGSGGENASSPPVGDKTNSGGATNG